MSKFTLCLLVIQFLFSNKITRICKLKLTNTRFIVLFCLYITGTNKTEEVFTMFTTAICRYLDQAVVARPNAATRREVLHKLIDHLLIIAICAGVSACAVFLTLFF